MTTQRTKSATAKKASPRRPTGQPPARVQPVARLREYATALEAGIALVLANPAEKSVHKLRTATRRVEGQLTLLRLLGHEEAAAGKKFWALLGEVRRACGKVRDCDVQQTKIAELDANADEASKPDIAEVRDALDKKRRRAAQALVDDLQHHAARLPARLEAVLHDLKPMHNEWVDDTRLEQVLNDWYHSGPAVTDDAGKEALHDVRKRAKLARYLAESGAALKATGTRYEDVQEAGGTWHDALVLRRTAKRFLGKRAPLVKLLREREAAGLAAFRTKLGSLIDTSKDTPDAQ